MIMTATGKQSISKTSHVVRARQRLERAVSGLEQAVLKMPPPSTDPELTPELTHELATLRAENAELRQNSRVVSGRLDGAIDKLKAVLDG